MTAYRLLADIGGTNARFALQAAGSGCADIEVLSCRDYDGIGAFGAGVGVCAASANVGAAARPTSSAAFR